jgi:hypothetical protein
VGKSKDEVVFIHAMNAYMVSEDMAPLILKLGTRWKWVISVKPWPLYPGTH